MQYFHALPSPQRTYHFNTKQQEPGAGGRVIWSQVTEDFHAQGGLISHTCCPRTMFYQARIQSELLQAALYNQVKLENLYFIKQYCGVTSCCRSVRISYSLTTHCSQLEMYSQGFSTYRDHSLTTFIFVDVEYLVIFRSCGDWDQSSFELEARWIDRTQNVLHDLLQGWNLCFDGSKMVYDDVIWANERRTGQEPFVLCLSFRTIIEVSVISPLWGLSSCREINCRDVRDWSGATNPTFQVDIPARMRYTCVLVAPLVFWNNYEYFWAIIW